MAAGKRGKRWLEVWLYLSLEHAWCALQGSGRVVAICFRPWAAEDAGNHVATCMTLYNVSMVARGPQPE